VQILELLEIKVIQRCEFHMFIFDHAREMFG
jgi:hypothetical protein